MSTKWFQLQQLLLSALLDVLWECKYANGLSLLPLRWMLFVCVWMVECNWFMCLAFFGKPQISKQKAHFNWGTKKSEANVWSVVMKRGWGERVGISINFVWIFLNNKIQFSTPHHPLKCSKIHSLSKTFFVQT